MLKPYFGENASGRGDVDNDNNVKSLASKTKHPTEEMLIMLIMLNPHPDFPKSPHFELTLLTLLTFPLSEACFHREELALLTFLAFW